MAIGMQTMLLLSTQMTCCCPDMHDAQATVGSQVFPFAHTLAVLGVDTKSMCNLEYMTPELNNWAAVEQRQAALGKHDALHDTRLWKSVRWYTGNKQITHVPDT